MEQICYTPIGILRTPFQKGSETPIQAAFSDVPGRAEIFPEYVEGLEDLEGFSHIILIYHFHRAHGFSLRERPFLDGSKSRGIFAVRYYRRPNPIGISTVRLVEIQNGVIEFRGADMLDSTPLLDIKPFVKAFDNRASTRDGWVDAQRLDGLSAGAATPQRLGGRDAGRAPPERE
ncbi:MAG: tRNA (N6-threonylcarbamoyladenosine(37)-N6)-methyltransferase TrmO [Methanomicrobiales archaeon]|nr:tRNA (N6-threonylcarbamoyladenosine(37)-N6)-methyltransferase TrmO [Methanomicrobiales archaeon]MDI6876046.1 tRNA (N6-threonylcarbamoyladenosine(37)-N6)-methyltransferase TrmO [Methanomicrobiales archaeon]